jgi:hypothetical protein
MTKPYTLRLIDNETGKEFVAALDLTDEGMRAVVEQMQRWAGVPDVIASRRRRLAASALTLGASFSP